MRNKTGREWWSVQKKAPLVKKAGQGDTQSEYVSYSSLDHLTSSSEEDESILFVELSSHDILSYASANMHALS